MKILKDSPWVSVKDSLPPLHEKVLVCGNFNRADSTAIVDAPHCRIEPKILQRRAKENERISAQSIRQIRFSQSWKPKIRSQILDANTGLPERRQGITMNRKQIRELVYKKYNGHCAYCGRKIAMAEMQVDHIVSRYNNGTDDLDNLNPSCRMCNFRKQTFTIEQFRKEIARQAGKAMSTFANRMSAIYGLINYTPHEITFYFEKHNVKK